MSGPDGSGDASGQRDRTEREARHEQEPEERAGRETPLPDAAGEAWPEGDPLEEEPSLERSMFAHPEWTVGVVLIIAVVMLLLGILGHPIWLLIGSPFILVLAVWILVRSVERSRRRRASSERS